MATFETLPWEHLMIVSGYLGLRGLLDVRSVLPELAARLDPSEDRNLVWNAAIPTTFVSWLWGPMEEVRLIEAAYGSPLLRTENRFPDPILSRALLDAVRDDAVDRVAWLWDEASQIMPFVEIARIASESGSIRTLAWLDDQGFKDMFDESWGLETMRFAAFAGHASIVSWMATRTGPPPNAYAYLIVLCAACNGKCDELAKYVSRLVCATSKEAKESKEVARAAIRVVCSRANSVSQIYALVKWFVDEFALSEWDFTDEEYQSVIEVLSKQSEAVDAAIWFMNSFGGIGSRRADNFVTHCKFITFEMAKTIEIIYPSLMGMGGLARGIAAAASVGHLDVAQQLASRGGGLTAVARECRALGIALPNGAFAFVYDWAHSMLEEMCTAGRLDIIQWIVPALREVRLPRGKTLIRHGLLFAAACGRGHLKLAQWIAENFKVGTHDVVCPQVDAEPGEGENYEPSVLQVACRAGNLELVEWFVSEFFLDRMDLRLKDNCDCNGPSCHPGYAGLAVDRNGEDGEGAGALLDVYTSGSRQLADWLVSNLELTGADIPRGESALGELCAHGDGDHLRWFLSRFGVTILILCDMNDTYALEMVDRHLGDHQKNCQSMAELFTEGRTFNERDSRRVLYNRLQSLNAISFWYLRWFLEMHIRRFGVAPKRLAAYKKRSNIHNVQRRIEDVVESQTATRADAIKAYEWLAEWRLSCL